MQRQICEGRRMRMPGAGLVGILGLALLLGGCKPNTPKVYRVGILGITAFTPMADGFKAKMNELGYVEGKNVVYEIQYIDTLPPGSESNAVKKFVADKVDLIFSFPTEPTKAAKAGTAGTDIPVVFGYAGLEGNDIIESVRHPGGNITGVRFPGPAGTAKRIEILTELAPRAKRVGIFYTPGYLTALPSLEQCRLTAKSLNVELVEVPTSDVEALRAATAARSQMADVGMDGILIMPDILSNTPDGFATIMEFANRHNLPVAGGMLYQADRGTLFSYSPSPFEIGEDGAALADKIFRGTPAGNIPVVSTEMRFVLNYKRALELGLTVPDGLLSMAMKIIR